MHHPTVVCQPQMRIWRLADAFPRGRPREWKPGGGPVAAHCHDRGSTAMQIAASNRLADSATVTATAWQVPSEDAQRIEVLA